MASTRRRSPAPLSSLFLGGLRALRGLPQSALLAALLGPSFAGVSACETSCHVPDDPEPEVIESGIVDRERGTYASSSFNGKFLEFRPKKRYEFRHGLGGTPKLVTTWVSFTEEPLPLDKEFGNAAESAGNIVIIEAVTPEYVRIRNDTCETFYLRLFASDPESSPAQAERDGDGGNDDGEPL